MWFSALGEIFLTISIFFFLQSLRHVSVLEVQVRVDVWFGVYVRKLNGYLG
jgi:hypothetical protein